MAQLCIGLMSGTSMDGIDAVLARIGDASLQILHSCSHAYPAALRNRLQTAVNTPLDQDIDDLASLDQQTARCFSEAAELLIQQSGITADEISVIGSHGQTLRHQPDIAQPYSLQIGDPGFIARHSGIRTVGDFRRADIEAGGQGAPLVPPFHAWLFGDDTENRVVLNIGGIANITVLHSNGSISGFDTGPGNTLMDQWIRHSQQREYDDGGRFAASGTVNDSLLNALRNEPYFDLPPPKSTGLELFNLEWLQHAGLAEVRVAEPAAADVQATLCELTAATVADAVKKHASATQSLFVCGGGVHNAELMRRLGERLPDVNIASTDALGLAPDWVEATAFAWLGLQTLSGLPGNLPAVTGADRAVVLGTLHEP